MKILRQIYRMKATPGEVFKALTEPDIIERWSGAPAIMDARPGTAFKLWGGDIYGVNRRVVPDELLEQDWYGGRWDEPSKVVFTLESEGDYTKVELFQENIPEKSFDSISEGWKLYYLGPMKEMFDEVHSGR